MDEKAPKEECSQTLTVKDLPVALEVMVQFVLGSYGFFFAFGNRLPIISVVVSALSLASYVLFSVGDIFSGFETRRLLLAEWNVSHPWTHSWKIWQLFGFQMLIGLSILLPPLLILLWRGNLFTAR